VYQSIRKLVSAVQGRLPDPCRNHSPVVVSWAIDFSGLSSKRSSQLLWNKRLRNWITDCGLFSASPSQMPGEYFMVVGAVIRGWNISASTGLPPLS
jgi:hypothetical protein